MSANKPPVVQLDESEKRLIEVIASGPLGADEELTNPFAAVGINKLSDQPSRFTWFLAHRNVKDLLKDPDKPIPKNPEKLVLIAQELSAALKRREPELQKVIDTTKSPSREKAMLKELSRNREIQEQLKTINPSTRPKITPTK